MNCSVKVACCQTEKPTVDFSRDKTRKNKKPRQHLVAVSCTKGVLQADSKRCKPSATLEWKQPCNKKSAVKADFYNTFEKIITGEKANLF